MRNCSISSRSTRRVCRLLGRQPRSSTGCRGLPRKARKVAGVTGFSSTLMSDVPSSSFKAGKWRRCRRKRCRDSLAASRSFGRVVSPGTKSHRQRSSGASAWPGMPISTLDCVPNTSASTSRQKAVSLSSVEKRTMFIGKPALCQLPFVLEKGDSFVQGTRAQGQASEI